MHGFLEHRIVKPNTIQKRLYQEIIAARVLENGNTLVVAPTALGKTVIALMVSAALLEKNPNGKVLFLAPTRPLAMQHKQSFEKFLAIEKESIALLDGNVRQSDRKESWEKARIICATPQTIENDIVTANISLDDCMLCIFDEAHRAVGNYSYVYIAQQLERQAKNAIILALTASPGATEEKIKGICETLFIKNIEIKTPSDADVAPYSHEIETEWRTTTLPESFIEIKSHLEEFMREQLDALNKLGFAKTTSLKYYGKMRLLEMQASIRKRLAGYRKTQPSLYQAATRCAMLMKASHAVLLLETQGINALHAYLERMKKKSLHAGATRALKQMFNNASIVAASNLTNQLKQKGTDHPKKELLKEVVLGQLASNPTSRIIVFNHYRDSISSLVSFLNALPNVSAHRFVGQAARESEKGLSQKEQAEIISNFREGKLNVIVATSVAEEGLDIPAVELVVFFEPVPSEIRSIQRMGRTGRTGKGRVAILMAKGTRDEAFYGSSIAKEKKMHSALALMKKDLGQKKLEKQETLLKYSGEGKETVLVYADTRELASQVIKELKELGCFIKTMQLETGDYVLSDDIVVERKTVGDFLESIVDGRLFQQVAKLSANYKNPLFLVEGDAAELFSLRDIHRNAVIGALTSIACNYRVPILFTKDASETAEYLFVTAKREQLGREKDIRLRVGRKWLSLKEQQQFIVESLPLVGPSMAKKLLQRLGSVQRVFTASEKVLMAVEGMGEKKARLVRKTIDSLYSDEEHEK